MTDWTTQAQDRITAAAHAELNAIQRRIEETWDIEASLQEILLEEHYHAFVDKRSRSFDAESALADILDDVVELGPGDRQVLRPQDPEGTDCVKWLLLVPDNSESKVDPVDRVRRTAARMEVTLLELDKVEDAGITVAIDLFLYRTALEEARCQADELHDLADALDAKRISKEAAFGVLRQTADAFMNLYTILDKLPPWHLERLKGRVFELGAEASGLQPAIARLFDPSDDTVGSLL